jgi:hypothetical protein
MRNPDIRRHSIVLFKLMMVAATYAAITHLGHQFFKGGTVVGHLEASSGFALAVMLLGGRRYAWGILLGGIFLGATQATLEEAVATPLGWVACVAPGY